MEVSRVNGTISKSLKGLLVAGDRDLGEDFVVRLPDLDDAIERGCVLNRLNRLCLIAPKRGTIHLAGQGDSIDLGYIYLRVESTKTFCRDEPLGFSEHELALLIV